MYFLPHKLNTINVQYCKCTRADHVPGDEAGTSQVSEGVDHGDNQGHHHNTGVYDVEFGAEVHLKPRNMEIKEKQDFRSNWVDHFTDSDMWIGGIVLTLNESGTFPVQLPFDNVLFKH